MEIHLEKDILMLPKYAQPSEIKSYTISVCRPVKLLVMGALMPMMRTTGKAIQGPRRMLKSRGKTSQSIQLDLQKFPMQWFLKVFLGVMGLRSSQRPTPQPHQRPSKLLSAHHQRKR